ncbi:hypothetical protein ABFX02_12G120700 [Erythranthe guttata]
MDAEGDQVSMTVLDYETAAYDSDCESSVSDSGRLFREFARNGMVKLEESAEGGGGGGGGEYGAVMKSFLVDMRFLGEEIDVVAVHKNMYSSVAGQAKLEAFRVFSRAVAARRGGDANVKYGWYGGSPDEIRDVVTYGFVGSGKFEKGISHGVGIHLSPVNSPFDSAMKAKEDENGVRHMLLCRVILGNTEIIGPGSEQSHPSSTQFDSGIDNPIAPTQYIVWTSYMNSHIFPNYIISFRAPCLIGLRRTWRSATTPNSLSMSFPVFLKVLSRFVHPSKVGLILNYYNEFRENKIVRSQLIRRLRNIVGDKLLSSVIKLCRNERV